MDTELKKNTYTCTYIDTNISNFSKQHLNFDFSCMNIFISIHVHVHDRNGRHNLYARMYFCEAKRAELNTIAQRPTVQHLMHMPSKRHHSNAYIEPFA